MSTLFYPVYAMLIGLALLVFGAIHTLSHYPGTAGFDAFITSLPALATVAWFFAGVVALMVGALLITWGVRTFRRRLRQVRAALYGPRVARDPDDDPDWAEVHPYH